MDSKVQVVVLGLGYIGLPTSAVIAGKGIKVHGVDVNETIVKTINSGKIHIVEPDLEGLVNHVVNKKLLTAHLRPTKADVFMITVPTPFKENYQPDISYVQAAVESIIEYLQAGNLVIIESTSPVGTTEEMAKLIFSRRPDLKGKIYMSYCPERVLPGNILYELVHNDRIVGGLTPPAAEKAAGFYSLFVEGKIYQTNARTAEMCKLVENSYRDVNIAFANELSIICDRFNIDVWELIKLANCHPRVNILKPGAGVGGHCIAVDPWFIVSSAPDLARLIKTARLVNDDKPNFVVRKISESLKKNNFSSVACFGCTYKPDTDDVRESPAIKIIQQLAKENPTKKIFLVEPYIKHLVRPLNNYQNIILKDADGALKESPLAVFLVGHKVFKNISAQSLKGKMVIDICGLWKQ